MMKLASWLASLLLASLLAVPALSQTGQLSPGQVWGNAGVSRGVAAPTTGILASPFVNGTGAIINPAAPSNNIGFSISQTTPNAGSVAGPVLLNSITVIDQGQTVTGSALLDSYGQIPNQTTALRLNHRVTGGSANHFGISVATDVTGSNGGVAPIVGGTRTNVTATGNQWDVIGYGNIGPSGNVTGSVIGIEGEMLVATGGAVTNRIALSANSQGPVAATGTDAAIDINLAAFNPAPYNGAAPFKDGIYFDNNLYGAATFPIATTGNVMRGDAGTVANFASFPNLTVTGNVFSFPSFTVSGTGGAIMGVSGAAAPANGLRVQSNSAAALSVATSYAAGSPVNAAFQVDASTGSAVTGLYLQSKAAGSGLSLLTTSSGSNENLAISAKGTGTITHSSPTIVSSSSAGALIAGPNGATNPTFQVDASAASAATGIYIFGRAAGSNASILTISSATNEGLTIDAKGSGTITLGSTSTGAINLSRNTVVTSNSANAFVAGPGGVTNPVLQVDGSVASQAVGVRIVGNAAAAGAGISVISSGANEPLAINGKGSGTISIGNISSGSILLGAGGGGTTISNALTYGGVTLNNAVTGTGNMVLSAGPTFTGTVVMPTHVGGTAVGSTATINGTSNGSPSSAFLGLQTNGQFVSIGNAAAKTFLDVNENLSSSPSLIVSTSLMRMQAADASLNGGFEMVSYNSTALSGNIMVGAAATGTSASPAATGAGGISQYMYNMRGYGYNGTSWQAGALMVMQNNGVWSDSNQGANIDFYTTPLNSTTIAQALRINGSGGLGVATTSDPGVGLIYINSASFLMRNKTSWSNGAAAQTGTLTNAPAAGNPTKWIPIDDNGTTRYIPAW